jgi:hypothetical protein
MRLSVLATSFALITYCPPAAWSADRGCLLSAAGGNSLSTQLTKTSQNAWIDAAFNKEIAQLNALLPVRPGFFLLNESSNAFAIPNAIQPGTEGTVAFGSRLMLSEFQESGQNLNFSIPAIMAHEFSHILQFRHHTRLAGKLMELQADYLAGWYMGNRDRFSGWSSQAFRGSLVSFYEKGDYDFNSQRHHGTPAERAAAITEGFQNAGLSLSAAYSASLRFVNADHETVPEPANRDDQDAKVAACMERRIQRCMDACVYKFRNSPSSCQEFFCEPTQGPNQAWERRCRARFN